jgi:2-haloacid dehalogenase
MTITVTIEPNERRPTGHRAVPLLTEPALGHYPEFRAFLVAAFGLDERLIGPSGLLTVDGRFYELVFLGRSGHAFPVGVEISALVPGLEPLDEMAADRDLWAILEWLIDGVGGEWTTGALTTMGRIYRVPAVAGRSPAPVPTSAAGPRRDVLVFDLYGTLVDPLEISAELERSMPPDDAALLARVWRAKQLEYSFRLTVMRRYQDFGWVTERALEFALLDRGLAMSSAEKAEALARYDTLKAYPDVIPGLEMLAAMGHETALLSNGSPSMLRACLENSGLRAHLPRVISVDTVRAFKPDPEVYRSAARALNRQIGETRLVSCNPFDVIGAAAAGMRTAWINRSGAPFDTIDAQPDVTVASLTELASVLERIGPADTVTAARGVGGAR